MFILAERKKRKVHVFEGDPVTLRCPVGDITRQEWVRTNKMDGHMVQVDDTSLQKDNVTVCGYHISTAQVADEGMYECYESDAVLQEVELTVNGKLRFNVGHFLSFQQHRHILYYRILTHRPGISGYMLMQYSVYLLKPGFRWQQT